MNFIIKILGLILKLQEQIDNKIFNFLSDCSHFIKKYTPQKIKNYILKFKAYLKSLKFGYFRTSLTFNLTFKLKLLEWRELIKDFFINLFIKIRTIISYLSKENLIRNIAFIKKNARPLIKEKLKQFFKLYKLYPTKMCIISLLLFSLLPLYILKIHHFNKERERQELLEVAKNQIVKPPYHRLDFKTALLLRIELPVFDENTFNKKSVQVEFSAETSNQLTMLFIKKNQHVIMDHIILNLLPISADLPFQEEGRKIISNKIMDEINNFLEKNEIRGKIVNLYVEKIIDL